MRAGLRRRGKLLARGSLRLQDFVTALHVWIDRLTRNEEMLDLARAFEDAIDAHVTEDALDRIALLATRLQRLRRLVATAAPYLHQMIRALPRHLGVEQLRHGCF